MTQSLPHAFKCAAEGVAFAFKQRNMCIDAGFAVAAVVLGFALRIDAPSWLAIVICIGAVNIFGYFLLRKRDRKVYPLLYAKQ